MREATQLFYIPAALFLRKQAISYHGLQIDSYQRPSMAEKGSVWSGRELSVCVRSSGCYMSFTTESTQEGFKYTASS